MKYCVDCKHCTGPAQTAGPATIAPVLTLRCFHPRVVSNDPVTGEELGDRCYIQRADGWLSAWLWDECGMAGRFFEPKE